MKKEILNRIIAEISSEKLTSSECRKIANALKKQHNVIGGALYTTDDAECYVVIAVTNCMLKGKRAEEVHKKSMEKFVSGFDDVLQDFLIDGEEGCFCDFAMETVKDETPKRQKKPSTETYEF